MATKLFFKDIIYEAPSTQRGTNTAQLAGGTTGWLPNSLRTTRGDTPSGANVATVTGPTNGLEIDSVIGVYEWISEPLDADVTISGTITFNLWAWEDAMTTNAAINCIIERLDSTGAVISTIHQTTRTTELGTSSTVQNFTGTPTSTNMLKGDRLRARVFADDAGTMAAGFVNFSFNGPTDAADGDSYITFTETFGFLTTAPTGSILYLTDTAGPAVGADIEREMWTSRGAGVQNDVVNTATGWTAPIRWTDTAGGTAVEWYSKSLAAFTLTGLVQVSLRALQSNFSANVGLRAEIAVCNDDGSGAVVWGAANYMATVNYGEITTTEAANVITIAGDDLSIAEAKRIRLRVYIDDINVALVTGHTATLYYAGTTGGASGDSFITFPQTLTVHNATPSRALVDSGVSTEKLKISSGAGGQWGGNKPAINTAGTVFAVPNRWAPSGGTNRGEVYVYNNSGTLLKTLAASDKGDSFYFGSSIAMSDDGLKIVVGSSGATSGGFSNAGQVYVMTATDLTWASVTETILTASDRATNDSFGSSVACSSDASTIAIGAPGEDGAGTNRGKVYIKSGSSWATETGITAASPVDNDNFGTSVSCSSSGAVVACGMPPNTSAGRTHVMSGGSWATRTILTPSDTVAGDGFGNFVNVSGDGVSVAVASNFATAKQYLFNGTTWGTETKKTGSDISGYPPVLNYDGSKWFIEANSAASNPSNAGRILVHSGSGFNTVRTYYAANQTAGDFFGAYSALSPSSTGGRWYVTCSIGNSGTLWLIDLQDDSLIKTLPPRTLTDTGFGGIIQTPYSNTGYGFGDFTASSRRAQSFIARSSSPIYYMDWYQAKNGSPTDNFVVELQSDSGSDAPSGTVLASLLTTAGASITGSQVLYSVRNNAGIYTPVAGTKYWIVVRRSGAPDSVNYFSVGLTNAGSGPDSYLAGITKSYSGSWDPAAAEIDFIFTVDHTLLASRLNRILTDTGMSFSDTILDRRTRPLQDFGMYQFPTVPLRDDFNRANEGPPPSANWTNYVYNSPNSIKVVSNRLVNNSAGYADAYWNTVYGPDTEVAIDVPVLANTFGIDYRIVNPNTASLNDYQVEINTGGVNGTLTLFTFDPGPTYTQRDQYVVPGGFASGGSIGIRAVGSKHHVYYKPPSGLWQHVHTFTDSTYSAAGYTGIEPLGATIELDNFYAGTFVTDSLVKQTAIFYQRTATDTGVAQTDSFRLITRRFFADTGVTQTDTIADLRNRIITDTGVTNTDTILDLRTRSLSDTGVTNTDSFRLITRRFFTDTGVTPSDSIVRLRTVPRTISDTGVTNTDSFRLVTRRFFADTGVTPSDTILTVRRRTILDTGVVSSDSIATLRVVPRAITDTGIAQSDSILSRRLHVVSDTGVTSTDSLSRGSSRLISDQGVTQSDTLVKRLGKTALDTGVTQSDSILSLRHRVIADTGITQTDTLQFTRRRTFADTGVTQSDTLDAFKAQITRPVSDVTVGTWHDTPLWSKLDEAIPSDADFITSAESPTSADICEVALSSLGDPARHDNHTLRYRIDKVPNGDQIQLTVRLMQGGTEIASWVETNLSTDITTVERTLTSGQAAAITNYADLRVRLEALKI